MKLLIQYCILAFVILSCTNPDNHKTTEKMKETIPSAQKENITKKPINKNLPTIGVLIFEGVIINEVVAPLDVFASSNIKGEPLFNVILIAKEHRTYTSAHGLQVKPDYTINEIPQLKVLVIPSSYTPTDQTTDKELITFIQKQNTTTDYIASHCAGAFLIGESGIADQKNIVTYVSGGKSLQEEYPELIVADDSKISIVEDGKFISSNGSLVSYIASLNLLEKLTDKTHRKHVEESILFDRLINN